MSPTQNAWADRCADLALHQDSCASCRDGRRCPTYAALRAAEQAAWNDDREARGLPRLAILPILGGIRLEAVR